MEITKICVDQGYDIDRHDNYTRSPIKHAELGQSHHIIHYLKLVKLQKNMDKRIMQRAEDLNKEDGQLESVINSLLDIGQETTKIVKEGMIQIMMRSIENKRCFNNFLLSLCVRMMEADNEKFEESELFSVIIKTATDIIHNGDECDWFWMNEIMLKANMWLFEDQDGKYLFHKMIDIANNILTIEAGALIENMKKDKAAWNKLDEAKVVDRHIMYQDEVTNGNVCDYDGVSCTKKFYDHQIYLPQMLMNAENIDDDFQSCIMNACNVDKITNIGSIKLDTMEQKSESESIKVAYCRHAVKSLEECTELNMDNDHFPTTASIHDFNSCTLIFEDIDSLLHGLKLFKAQIKEGSCKTNETILNFVQCANGYHSLCRWIPNADIKMNVVINHKKYKSMIGEIKFELRSIYNFKQQNENLFRLQNGTDFAFNSLEKVLPKLMDKTNELKICAASGDTDKLSELMIYSNYSVDDILTVDGESIFIPLCKNGSFKAFKFFASMLTEKQLIIELFKEGRVKDGRAKRNCVEYAVSNGRIDIVNFMLNITEVHKKYSVGDKYIFRLVTAIFIYCGNTELIDIWIKKFELTKEKISKMVDEYQYPDKSSLYARECVVSRMVVFNGPKILEKLRSIIGSELFAKISFKKEKAGLNALENCVQFNKIEHIKYFMSIPEVQNGLSIKEKTDKKQIDKISGRVANILNWLFYSCRHDIVLDNHWENFDFDIETLSKCIHIKFNDGTFIQRPLVTRIQDRRLKKMIQMIDDKFGINTFVDKVFKFRMIEIAMTSGSSTFKYLTSIPALIALYDLKNEDDGRSHTDKCIAIYRLIFALLTRNLRIGYQNQKPKEILQRLRITDDMVAKFCLYKYPKSAQNAGYNLFGQIIAHGQLENLKYLESIVGGDALVEQVLMCDEFGVNGLDYAIENEVEETLKYLLSLQGIKDFYDEKKTASKQRENAIFRLIYFLFVECAVDSMIDYVLSELVISKETVAHFVNYKYPKKSIDFAKNDGMDQGMVDTVFGFIRRNCKIRNVAPLIYHLCLQYFSYESDEFDAIEWTEDMIPYNFCECNIVATVIKNSTENGDEFDGLERLLSYIGDKALVESILRLDTINGLEQAIIKTKVEMIKYLMELDGIKNWVVTNQDMMKRCLYWMCEHYDKSVAQYLLETLGINEDIINELQKHKCRESGADGGWNVPISDEKIYMLLATGKEETPQENKKTQ